MEHKFRHNPYIKQSTKDNHLQDLAYIEDKIDEKLKDYPNFNGIDFCDVSVGGINIRGHHKEIKGYTFGEQPKIKYDFSNMEECIVNFVEMWKEYDDEKYVKWYKGFLEDGDKWGWD